MEWIEVEGARFLRHEMGDSVVAFGSRRSGASSGPYESLNVGVGTGDAVASVAENRSLLSRAAGIDPSSVVMARQVHGDQIVRHSSAPSDGPWVRGTIPEVEADGHVTEEPGVSLAVITADCLPVAVRGEGGLALAHCGWRGLAAGLAEKTAGLVGGEVAVIGPGIGPCCYEVGDEVLESFADFPDAIDGRRLDLTRVSRDQLRHAGVEVIDSPGICTCCQDLDFFSHRRDGARTGRQGTLAWLN